MSTDAQRALDMGAKHPYEVVDDHISPATDWAHAAARGVLADLSDRGGIKHELADVDAEVRIDIVEALSAIIRLAHTGESLSRDYFAAHAPQPPVTWRGGEWMQSGAGALASYIDWRWYYADAMLAEREKCKT